MQVRRRFRRNESSSGDDDSDVSSRDEFSSGLVNEAVASRGIRNAQKIRSSAALGKHDVKITRRRVMPKSNDGEDDFWEKIQLIRHEFSMKNLAENVKEKGEGESINKKRKTIWLTIHFVYVKLVMNFLENEGGICDTY